MDVSTAPRSDGPIVIIQPLPGVGDMVWHLRAIHSLAAAYPDHEKVLLTKYRSRADELFKADPAIERVIWVDRAEKHKGPGGFLALVRDLKQEGFSRSFQLHHSTRYAAALAMAGVPERFGYGTTAATRWLSAPPHLGSAHRRDHPIELAEKFIERCGFAVPKHADRLRVAPALANDVQQRYAGCPRPWISLGLGSSEVFKQWGAERFAGLIGRLIAQTPATFFLLGGPGEADFERRLQATASKAAGPNKAVLVPGFKAPMSEMIAVQAASDLYIGNDTAFLNISAAVGVPTYGLFGATEPLSYSPVIKPILPHNGPISRQDGMQRIDPSTVADLVLQQLTATTGTKMSTAASSDV
ncbi:MAG: glycosyltransferase family 9 protein [Pseudomonadota bacterium]